LVTAAAAVIVAVVFQFVCTRLLFLVFIISSEVWMRLFNCLGLCFLLVGFGGFALDKVYEYNLTGLKEVEFDPEKLQQLKDKGLSGKAYGLSISGQYDIIEKEKMDSLLKFRDLKDVSELLRAPLKSPMASPLDVLPYEVLLAKKKGHYSPPNEEKFIQEWASGFSESGDHCSDPADFVDPQTSVVLAEKMFSSSESAGHIVEPLNTQFRKNSNNMAVKSSPCTEDMNSRGSSYCFKININGQAVSEFLVGPRKNMGFYCKNLAAKATRRAKK
jgi:hypothetical protein